MTTRSITRLLAGAALFACAASHAATFIVDTTENSSTPIYAFCDPADEGDCSFHAALTRANATAEHDTIAFAIPVASDSGCNAATGVCRILLPNNGCTQFAPPFAVTNPVTIDGLIQPGASANTLPADGFGVNMQVKIELARTGYCRSGLQFQSSATIRGVAARQVGPVGNQTLPFFHFTALAGTQEYRVESSILGGDANGYSPLNTEEVLLNPILVEDCTQCQTSGSNRTYIGGTLPAQRNLFSAGGPGVRVRAFGGTAQAPTVVASIEGNLFGTGKSGMQNLPTSNVEGWINPDLGNGSVLRIGGASPASRNVFGAGYWGAIRPTIVQSTSVTGPANLFIQGNYFGLAVDGVTPFQMPDEASVGAQPLLEVARAQVGGAAPGEGNLFVGLASVVIVNSLGGNTVLGNQFIGNIGYWMLWDTGRPQYGILNDAGDADSYSAAGRLQNFPQTTAFSVDDNTLSITYKVDSLPAHSVYPLTVEFHRGARNNPEVLLGRDVYTAAEATTEKTVTFALPPGHGITSESMILAIANNADDAGSSVVSWSPVYLTFQGNAPAGLDTPTPIKVRVQGLGPFRPRGQVEISDSYPNGNAQICRATLVPSPNSPYRVEGTCEMTWSQEGSRTLTARYLDAFEAFHSDTGGTPTATRSIEIIEIDDDLFCDGFQDAGGCD